jgi:CDP-diacylglycerol--serine O-phosphatidyltransferase
VLLAGLLVFLGMLFDVLDGQIARLTKQDSRFGAELDSLCDIITFGLAPVFIMLTFSEVFKLRLLWGIGALYTVSAVLRLARFNVQQVKHDATAFFQGLPSPGAAGTVASFAIVMPALKELTGPSMPETSQLLGARLIYLTMVAVPILTLVLACLMVSRIKYPHIAHFLARRRSFYQLVELVFALVAIITLHELALPLIFSYFVFAPPFNQLRAKAVVRWQKPRDAQAHLAAPEDV